MSSPKLCGTLGQPGPQPAIWFPFWSPSAPWQGSGVEKHCHLFYCKVCVHILYSWGDYERKTWESIWLELRIKKKYAFVTSGMLHAILPSKPEVSCTISKWCLPHASDVAGRHQGCIPHAKGLAEAARSLSNRNATCIALGDKDRVHVPAAGQLSL